MAFFPKPYNTGTSIEWHSFPNPTTLAHLLSGLLSLANWHASQIALVFKPYTRMARLLRSILSLYLTNGTTTGILSQTLQCRQVYSLEYIPKPYSTGTSIDWHTFTNPTTLARLLSGILSQTPYQTGTSFDWHTFPNTTTQARLLSGILPKNYHTGTSTERHTFPSPCHIDMSLQHWHVYYVACTPLTLTTL